MPSDTWNGAAWVTATNLTIVGHKRLVRLPAAITTSQVRIRVTGSRLEPTLAEVGLFKQAVAILPPTISNRDTNGFVTLSNANGYAMVFTLDGTTPTTNSPVYTGPIALPFGGTVQAACLTPQGQLGVVASESFAGWAPVGWTVVAVDSQETVQANNAASKAIDGGPSTIWHTRTYADLVLPHYLTIDMGTPRWISGFAYLPRQDGNLNGTVAQYRFETSTNGLDWTTNIAAGVFGNIRNNPDLQDVAFAPVKARFFRFTALQEINTNGWTSAAEISVLPAGFDQWRWDHGWQTAGPNSDPDGNGLAALLEYAIAIELGSTATHRALLPSLANPAELHISLRRRLDLPDVEIRFEWSSDLITWEPASGVTIVSTTDNGDGTASVVYSLPFTPGQTAGYARARFLLR